MLFRCVASRQNKDGVAVEKFEHIEATPVTFFARKQFIELVKGSVAEGDTVYTVCSPSAK